MLGQEAGINFDVKSSFARKLVDTILRADMHIITTMRSKMEYAMEIDSNGRTQIRKVGLAPVQCSGIEYEFTWVIDMDH